jgi:hypothetical protein
MLGERQCLGSSGVSEYRRPDRPTRLFRSGGRHAGCGASSSRACAYAGSRAGTGARATLAAPAAPPLNAEQQFGLPEHTVTVKEVEAGRRAADLQRLEAHVVSITVAADQRLVFTLDDGQVWRQNSSEGELLAKQGDAVTISRGLLGSFWLQLPSGRGCKVSRLH